ncbi:MAG: hypothetical protein WCS86_02320 [Candidatus Paceibacterota bacterium]
MDQNKKLEWSELEYEEKERGNDWFWALGVVVVAGSIASFIYSNYFFGLLLIISGILLASFAIKKPDLVFYELNEKGLKIRSRLYPYENIKSFWVQKDSLKPTLFINSERLLIPILSIPIKQYNAEEIRNAFLLNNVPEEEMKEHVSEKIMDSLGF